MDETDELRDYIGRLLLAPEGEAFLVVTVAGSEDFLQMTAGEESVQIDFPLVTERQCGFESKIRATAEGEGLTIEENLGSDGAGFLAAYVGRAADARGRAGR